MDIYSTIIFALILAWSAFVVWQKFRNEHKYEHLNPDHKRFAKQYQNVLQRLEDKLVHFDLKNGRFYRDGLLYTDEQILAEINLLLDEIALLRKTLMTELQEPKK